MNKYTLFSEFKDKEIYGVTLTDALMHCRRLALPHRRIDDAIVPGEILTIKKVLCYEIVTNSTRGNHPFKRVIVELDDGTRISIDAMQAPPETLTNYPTDPDT